MNGTVQGSTGGKIIPQAVESGLQKDIFNLSEIDIIQGGLGSSKCNRKSKH